MTEKKEFLSIPEAAVLMGISRIAVFKKVKKGQLTAIRIGRNWAVPAAAVFNPVSAAAPRSVPPLPAVNTKSASRFRALARPKKTRVQAPSAVPAEPVPQKDPMDDMGWD